MGHAQLFPNDGGKGGRGKKDETRQSMTGFGSTLLKYARVVRAHLPLLAAKVRDGSATLNEAYETARREQQANATDEKRIAALSPDLAALRARAEQKRP